MGYEEEREGRSGHRRPTAKPKSEMEDDGQAVSDSFTHGTPGGPVILEAEISRSGQRKAAKRGMNAPGSSLYQEARIRKTRTMEPEVGYLRRPGWVKARRKEAEDIVYSSGERDADRDSLLCGIFVYQQPSGSDAAATWNPDEIKTSRFRRRSRQMSGYWTIAVFSVDSRNSSVGKAT